MPSQIGSTTYRLWTIMVAGEIIKILLPFHGKHMFLFIVAVFTRWSKIVLSTLAPADNRNYVIHSQLIRRTTATAIVTCAAG